MSKTIRYVILLISVLVIGCIVLYAAFILNKLRDRIINTSSDSISSAESRISEFRKYYICYSDIYDVRFLIHMHIRPIGPNSTENSFILLYINPSDFNKWLVGYTSFSPSAELRRECNAYISRYIISNSYPQYLQRDYSHAILYRREGILFFRNTNE